MSNRVPPTSRIVTTVLVASLGYFVDIYDLLLFSIVRLDSLRSLGITGDALLKESVFLLNIQMAGILVGGIVWGVMGDKRGRLSVLYGSILLYSLANIANAYVAGTTAYGVLRFVAGFGLAGELGAAVTLVSEMMSRERRGIGTTIVAAVGAAGAVFAATVAQIFPWRTAYLIGGGLGLLLLVARLGTFESALFDVAQKARVRRGDFFGIFADRERAIRFIACVFVGVPFAYAIGILVTFSPEIGRALGVSGPVKAGNSVLFAYIGMTLGDVASGALCQRIRSRKTVLFGFLAFALAVIVAYLGARGVRPETVYGICLGLGFAVGYWAVYVTATAEQFGTNLRATVATSVPNLARGMTVPLTLAFQALGQSFGLVASAFVLGVGCVFLAALSLSRLDETFGRNLDFLEK